MTKENTGKGKIALVTGGGTGVGKAITSALLAAGYTVVISGRRKDVLDDAADGTGCRDGGHRQGDRRRRQRSQIGCRPFRSDQIASSGGSTCSSTMPGSMCRTSRWKN